MARRRRGHEEHEMRPLLKDDDESFTDEAGPSTGSNEKLRLLVLGGDDALLNKACATILGERQNRDVFKFGILEPRKAQVRGRQISVLKTPSYWLKHLKSFLFFIRAVKAVRNDMEYFESQLFPGPHAFLLVHRDVKNSGRDNYLLHALSEVFGKKVLDYCMVLFIDGARHNDPKKNYCLKMCGGRYHTLKNTDDSVNELLKKIDKMTESKDSSFFTTHLECFRKASNYFQEEYEEKENKLRKELDDSKDIENRLSKKLNDSEEKENQLSKKLNDSKEKENQLSKKLNDSKEKESQLSKKLNDSKEKESQLSKKLDDSKEKENQLSKKLNDSKDKLNQMSEKFHTSSQSEKQLNEELIIYKDRERQLKEEMKDLKDRENQMSEKFCTSFHHEKQLNEELIIYKDRERQLKDDKEKLQRKVEQLNEKEKQLQNNLTKAKVKEAFLLKKLQSESNIIQREKEVQAKENELNERERELDMRVKELEDRQRNLDERQKELEIREREETQRDVRSREHHQTTADAAGELKSRDDSQTSESPGIQKPAR